MAPVPNYANQAAIRRIHATSAQLQQATTTAATSPSEYPTSHEQISQPLDTQNFINNQFTPSKASQWIDLYDYAVRTEWLGHGIYANKGCAPVIDSYQLADAFLCVIDNEPTSAGARMRQKASALSEACKLAGGVHTVADTLIRAAETNSMFTPEA